jgi:hypothetical protein
MDIPNQEPEGKMSAVNLPIGLLLTGLSAYDIAQMVETQHIGRPENQCPSRLKTSRSHRAVI